MAKYSHSPIVSPAAQAAETLTPLADLRTRKAARLESTDDSRQILTALRNRKAESPERIREALAEMEPELSSFYEGADRDLFECEAQTLSVDFQYQQSLQDQAKQRQQQRRSGYRVASY